MDKKTIKNLILKRQKEIVDINRLSTTGQKTVVLDQTRVGRLSRMDAMQAQEMNKEGQRRRDLEMRRLIEALKRVDDEDYGECEQCGEQISEGRMQLDPAAEYCIICASKLEEG